MLKNKVRLQKKFSLQEGSALLSALFIMTLVAIAATAMSVRLQTDTYRTQHTLLSDKLYLASQGVTYWAMSELSQKKQKHMIGGEKGKILNFPAHLEKIYPHVKLQGAVYDLQARFNLNNLIDKQYYSSFLVLLDQFSLKLSGSQKKSLLTSVIHWVNSPKLDAGQSPLDNVYAKKNYLAAQQLLSHLSEFRLIQFVNAKLYLALSDYLSALPQITAINLNTAPPLILATLGRGLKKEQVQKLMAARQNKDGIKDFAKISPLLEKLHIPKDQITLESQYFLCVAYVQSEHLKLTTYTVLKKSIDKKGKILISILREGLNAYG